MNRRNFLKLAGTLTGMLLVPVPLSSKKIKPVLLPSSLTIPMFSFTNDTNTGFFRTSESMIGVSVT